MTRACAALMLCGLTLLCGCSTVSSWMPFSSSAAPSAAAACPSAAILHSLSQTAVFPPGGSHEPVGVAFYGILSEVNAKCDQAAGAMHVALDVIVIGERGPAIGKGDIVDLQYFVAVTGSDQTILNKRSFAVRIAIPAGAKRAGVTDHIEETIPLAGRTPGDLSILLGFQQTPDVIDFYKHFRGRSM
ncbi:MAG TPA: hypothetical protein VGS13_15305 [Stellaceae bacterium]|nr:hypothetical protein [Stellaceae bacterium]